ncbi:FAD-binding and (Fe-S)-binding domain-containing protein [Parapedobacter indicus]|uniref:FAD/FMN-containing dehydrogenase n=1 Tax=Parapedobacter indicus TaxID=1477437 RepID=A0A1I3FU92_9SPHI|nr:FAD-binding and (Fe-S)-binding domain-containing protein [Parapedobacter indicus]PPL03890.1 FAD/FMN-containing dehydrogenase [Parapedobacter indicus]SFI14727.1 FAD/FMN-containing dehydrogenase [Parapedobacter indicus]
MASKIMKALNRKEGLSELGNNLKGSFYHDESPEHQTLLRAYSTDASVYQERPLAVAIPKDTDDLKRLIGFAQAHQVTLIPRTAGTSLAGQVVGRGIVVDVSKHFNQVLEVNVEERWVRVQPGVIRDDLNAYLRPYGLMFGPETSTASRAMVGGMVGNNSCGLHSIVWGDTRSHLLSANVLVDDASEVVFEALNEKALFNKLKLAGREGDIYRRMNDLLSDPENREAIKAGYPKPALTRRNTGYALDMLSDTSQPFNFCKLFAGSEGTLGILTEAKLNLLPLPPKEIGLLCVHCNTIVESLHANVVALRHRPEASELVDKYIMDFTKGHPTYQYNRFFIEGDPEALLMVEFRGATPAEIEEKAADLKADLLAAGLGYAYPLITGPDTNLVWDVRKAGLGLIRNLPGDTQPVNLIEDCAVSPEDLPAYIIDVQQLLDNHGLKASYYAHAGAGELHVEPLINLKTAEGKKAFRAVLAETTQLVKKYNGSLSGEHGDGRLRGEFIGAVLGDKVYALLKQVKAIFDPSGVFNANKIVDTPPMDEFLRYEQDTPTVKIDTVFDFSRQESILRLSEKCSGSGDCRKSHITGGTMCPSYMATREEKDTTRARANILRQFLTHSLKVNRFDHAEIKEVMDLCLSCKGCKTECPSGVDIAKMKAEFLQHYHDANGTPFRTWVIANFTKSQQLASYLPGLYNAVIRNKALSGLVKKMLGFAQDRSLPEVGKTTLRRWIARQRRHQKVEQRKRRVYLFCDEFTDYNDVAIGQTAYRLLTALGYEVELAEHVESGRTYLSKGLVRRAKAIANRNVRNLKGIVTADTPLIGIEPSAILTFRDEYPDLVDNELVTDAYNLAKNALLIDEFLLTEMEAGHIAESMFTELPRKIKLHGHCYQKAFHLVETTAKILSFPKSYQIETIPSGCCGMAGSFGYEKEHYEVSMKVGELVLLPTVRNTSEDVLIAAPGTSCRHQIKDGVGRRAYHPVEILWEALRK